MDRFSNEVDRDLEPGSDATAARTLIAFLESMRVEMRRRHVDAEAVFRQVHPAHLLSAANLIDYLTLRQYDLREIQVSLAELGLSSLGRSEEHVITTLERVIDNLRLIAGEPEGVHTEVAVHFFEGKKILSDNARELLGPDRIDRPVRILVTMPSEAAQDVEIMDQLFSSGMDCARINCAHDDPPTWRLMVQNIRRGAKKAGRECPILMDLPGPKMRTGPVAPGPRVVRLHPNRDSLGNVTSSVRALLVADDEANSPTHVLAGAENIPVDPGWLRRLIRGDQLTVVDSRGAKRVATVGEVHPLTAEVEFEQTTYLSTGNELRSAVAGTTSVGLLPEIEQFLTIHVDDVLTLSRDLTLAEPSQLRIGCTLGDALDKVSIGDRVFFDDGKIGGLVIATRLGEVDIKVTSARAQGAKLRAEKGINLPDTDLDLPALSEEDQLNLRHVVELADIVGLSFIQDPKDVTRLLQRLHELGHGELGVVLKIETVRGFTRLPELLLASMSASKIGVMVARGDLAVECGFERLAEVQEEILFLCEAAHVPVIWATQVLDQMARTGQPSRAEVSDAVMAGRAECVMLNKGPHIVEAVSTLESILSRMDSFQHKKTSLLRRLTSWSSVPGSSH